MDTFYNIMSSNAGGMQAKRYESDFEELIEQLIFNSNFIRNERHAQNCRQKIAEIYRISFEWSIEKLGVPDIEDICLDVMEHNMEVLSQLAALDMICGKWCSAYSHGEDIPFFLSEAENGESEEDKLYEAYLAAWEEDYSYELYGARSTIMDALNEAGLCYQISERELNGTMSRIESSTPMYIYMNDCQNLLFPDWHIAVIVGAYRENYFTAEEDYQDLLRIRFYGK